MGLFWQNYAVALKPWMSDGWHYQTSSNLTDKCPTHVGIIEVRLLFLRRESTVIRLEDADSGCFSCHQIHIVFYLPHCSLQGFLLASACLFCWMPWNADVLLKYWIHPSLGCELCLLLKEEKGERGEVGSLNKLLSVYLIYGAIRSVQCRLKLNFSSCEAS